MLRKITLRGAALAMKKLKVFSFVPIRSFANDDDKEDDCLLPGSGLKTVCGNFKEEAYFKKKNEDLIKKLREEGTTVKSVGYFDAGDSMDAGEVDTEARQIRESCLPNKCKNAAEEAYFLEEQKQTMITLAKILERYAKYADKTIGGYGTDSDVDDTEAAGDTNATDATGATEASDATGATDSVNATGATAATEDMDAENDPYKN